ncbi:hypothetical protein [Thiomonas sp. FB-6]|uniref:hypothetical protein n=1 Tax=Thiomonas sp. FB-6 TaxID=1158291 RepID=UPI0003695C16|nr:hypothetical protein [Thiomonas sp. FB-6]
MSELKTRAVEAGAVYRAAEIYSTPQRRGLMPFAKTRFYELVASGQLPTIKIRGGRATMVRGADLLKLLEVAQ